MKKVPTKQSGVTFYLFRHGETDWNAEGRFQGHIDISLNEQGRRQARELGEKLKEHQIEAIFSSDLSRAIETAKIVAREIGIAEHKIFQDPGIKEAFLGDAQGLTVAEIHERFGMDIVERWKSNLVSDADVSYPGGESGWEVVARSMDAVRRFAAIHPEFTRVGIATHGGVIRRMMHRVLSHRNPSTALGKPPHIAIPNGVIYRVQYEPAENPAHEVWVSLDI